MALTTPRPAVATGALLTCGLLAGCASQGAAPVIRTDPARLVLSLGQLPYPGFQLETATPGTGRRSNPAVAGGSPAALRTLERQGRITGYTRDFDRPVLVSAAVGPVIIQSVATQYRTAAEAAAALGRAAAGLVAAGDTQLSAGRVGQAALAFTGQRTAAGVTYGEYIVEWREHNILNGIVIEGNALGLDVGYALTLARVQDRNERA